ncbi:MAG: NUDIX hydrolase [Deltaproteobacteria bacterium]|nr:NUDIX hydrolase [Deltaproteobacteria bacterium]MBI4373352.1 NUDIX hydrolase [Deltaproteobacteria bacterium]
MKWFSFLVVLALSLALGCAKGGILGSSKGECRVNPKLTSKATGNAGCFILSDDKMLIHRHRKSGKLDLPGGTAEKGETSQCTAHRETGEETGASVEVGRLLARFDNGFKLYDCKPLKKVRLKVPKSGKNEVIELLLVDPTKTRAKDWRFPSQQPVIARLYRQRKMPASPTMSSPRIEAGQGGPKGK